MFETKGRITQKDFAIMQKKASPAYSKALGVVFYTLMTFGLIFSLYVKDFSLSVTYFVLVLCFTALLIFKKKKALKIQLDRLKELGTDCVDYRSSFEDDGLHINNETTGASGVIKYKNFKKLIETGDVMYVLTKARQFVPIFRKELTDMEYEELKSFLKDKMKK